MNLAPYSRGATLLIVVEAERLDAGVAVRFKDTLRDLAAGTEGDVVLDLTEVAFLDSSGLGALVSAKKQLGPDRQLVLAGLAPAVARVFELTRMNSVFGVYPTADEALGRRAHAS